MRTYLDDNRTTSLPSKLVQDWVDVAGGGFCHEIAAVRISLRIIHDSQHVLQRQLLARCDCGISYLSRKLVCRSPRAPSTATFSSVFHNCSSVLMEMAFVKCAASKMAGA